MQKAELDTGIATEFGTASLEASASREGGIEGGVNVSLRPDAQAAASGLAGAAAYSWLAGLAGAWTAPLLVALGAGVWFYRKRKARQQAKKGQDAP